MDNGYAGRVVSRVGPSVSLMTRVTLPPPRALDAAAIWGMTDAQLVEALEQQVRDEAVNAANRALLVASAEERGIRNQTEAPSLERWLTQRLRLSRSEANAWVRDAQALTAVPEAREAMVAGQVTVEQGRLVAQAVRDFPAVRPAVRAEAVGLLVEQAAVLDPVGLTRVARSLHETLTYLPDIDDPAEAAATLAEAQAAEASAAMERALDMRHLTWRRHQDGSVSGRFRLDPLAGQTRLTALSALTARRDHDPRRPDHDSGCPSCAADAAHDGAPLADPLSRDTRTLAQRNADALATLARLALGADGMPSRGGARPTLLVATTVAALQDQLATAGALPLGRPVGAVGGPPSGRQVDAVGALPYGGEVDASTLRRLACDAEILPAVLAGPSEVLDLGRSRRLFSLPQRRALALRDRGCIHPGCDRVPAECEAHHHHPGWAGGACTDLACGALLCDRHHDQHHRQGWQVRLAVNGHPEVVPPATLDTARIARQHHRFHHLVDRQ